MVKLSILKMTEMFHGENEKFYIFVHSELTVDEMVAMLIKNYNPKKEK